MSKHIEYPSVSCFSLTSERRGSAKEKQLVRGKCEQVELVRAVLRLDNKRQVSELQSTAPFNRMRATINRAQSQYNHLNELGLRLQQTQSKAQFESRECSSRVALLEQHISFLRDEIQSVQRQWQLKLCALEQRHTREKSQLLQQNRLAIIEINSKDIRVTELQVTVHETQLVHRSQKRVAAQQMARVSQRLAQSQCQSRILEEQLLKQKEELDFITADLANSNQSLSMASFQIEGLNSTIQKLRAQLQENGNTIRQLLQRSSEEYIRGEIASRLEYITYSITDYLSEAKLGQLRQQFGRPFADFISESFSRLRNSQNQLQIAKKQNYQLQSRLSTRNKQLEFTCLLLLQVKDSIGKAREDSWQLALQHKIGACYGTILQLLDSTQEGRPKEDLLMNIRGLQLMNYRLNRQMGPGSDSSLATLILMQARVLDAMLGNLN